MSIATFGCRMTTGAALFLLFAVSAFASTITDKPPSQGGYTYSLGLPSLYKPFAGFEMQSYRTGDLGELGGLLNLGVNKDLGNPIVGAAALGVEAYGGYRGQAYDGGLRSSFSIPSLLLGAGVDYNIKDDTFDFLMRLDVTGRRGGVFGAGTTLAIRYLPTRENTFSVGVNVPLWGKHLGESRARRDHVVLDDRQPKRMELDANEHSEACLAALEDLHDRVHWVFRFTQPFAEVRGGDAQKAIQPDVAEIAERIASRDDDSPDGHTARADIQAYHEGLERAFALALVNGRAPDEQEVAQARKITLLAREALLEDVLLPYNRLIGQHKKNDSLCGLIAVAQARFGREVLRDTDLDRRASRELWFVFQTVCDYIEEERKLAHERFEDSRLVWLPLQLALTEAQHDSQAELDAIIARAVEQPFTRENRLWYIVNESFQWEMARTVRMAEDYHVLWIHDYRGINSQGDPDLLAIDHTINYLETMTQRVRAYDETGKFPSYFIIIDQHFFEINDGRRFLRILQDPFGKTVDLPDEYAGYDERLKAAQSDLKQAVEDSQLLNLERSQYGEEWLRNYIKVHVTITNQADPSFYSRHVAGIVPVPDNNMRDHRKIAFFDITEEDPYRGVAMFTGMGIGEHYAGANWEDRALMIQGPGALEVKAAVRHLLETQGFEPEQIPFALRPREKAPDYGDRIAAEHAARTPSWLIEGGFADRGGVIQLHSETGFFDKPVEVSKAILYSLMPAGSILQVPDSLWQNYLYGSLLAGSSLRGCRVLVISPAFDNAPAGGAANMARAHDLMKRLLLFGKMLDDEIESEGGLLAVGLYSPQQDVGDLEGRFAQAMDNHPKWLARVYPEVVGEGRQGRRDRMMQGIRAALKEVGYTDPHAADQTADGASAADIASAADGEKPKLHLKANFFASAVGWEKLMQSPELGRLLVQHIRYVAEQEMTTANATNEDLPDVRGRPAALAREWLSIVSGMLEQATPEEREQIIYYLTVGSVNLDYRSMMLNAETMLLVSSWQSLTGFVDFLLLPGLCEWPETPEELDALLPPPSGFRRRISNFLRILL